jgi:transposase-like protein
MRQIKTPSRECSYVVRCSGQLEVFLHWATRVSYPVEIKVEAIELRLADVTKREVMEELSIRNKSQVETWLHWYRADELHRLEQSVGKQYCYGKGPQYELETEKLHAEVR